MTAALDNPSACWLATMATATSCRWENVDPYLNWGDEPGTGLTAGRFLVQFRYVVGGSAYAGEFGSRVPYDRGQQFEVLYDPECPELHSYGDRNQPSWLAKLATWGLGFGGLALLMHWALMRA